LTEIDFVILERTAGLHLRAVPHGWARLREAAAPNIVAEDRPMAGASPP